MPRAEPVEIRVTLGITVDPDAWREAFFVTEKGLASDVADDVRQAIVDGWAAHFEKAITRVEILKTEQAS